MFLVRWANVREDHVKGVERFLIDFYNPPKNIHSVEAQPIEVNLPFPAIKWELYTLLDNLPQLSCQSSPDGLSSDQRIV